MKIKDIFQKTVKELNVNNIAEAKNETALILSHILNLNKTELNLNFYKEFPKKYEKKLQGIIEKRIKRIPLAYILKEVEFMGLKFRVNKNCFIPRQETELLVESTLKIIGNFNRPVKILDIGTGCGNIAISISKYSNNIEKIYATDINKRALKLAKLNSIINKTNSIEFIHTNLFDALINKKIKLDIIVSNPPYVDEKEYHSLQPEILKEPVSALFAGEDGLSFYIEILKKVKYVSKDKTYILLEIGYNQAEKVSKILEINKIKLLEIKKDYQGLDRIIIGIYNGEIYN